MNNEVQNLVGGADIKDFKWYAPRYTTNIPEDARPSKSICSNASTEVRFCENFVVSRDIDAQIIGFSTRCSYFIF